MCRVLTADDDPDSEAAAAAAAVAARAAAAAAASSGRRGSMFSMSRRRASAAPRAAHDCLNGRYEMEYAVASAGRYELTILHGSAVVRRVEVDAVEVE